MLQCSNYKAARPFPQALLKVSIPVATITTFMWSYEALLAPLKSANRGIRELAVIFDTQGAGVSSGLSLSTVQVLISFTGASPSRTARCTCPRVTRKLSPGPSSRGG
ncbi:MAG: hypothetical protein RL274_2068 [Pseudomonadota bacterium]